MKRENLNTTCDHGMKEAQFVPPQLVRLRKSVQVSSAGVKVHPKRRSPCDGTVITADAGKSNKRIREGYGPRYIQKQLPDLLSRIREGSHCVHQVGGQDHLQKSAAGAGSDCRCLLRERGLKKPERSPKALHQVFAPRGRHVQGELLLCFSNISENKNKKKKWGNGSTPGRSSVWCPLRGGQRVTAMKG